MRKIAVASLLALSLAGCDAATVTGEYYSALYQPDLVGLATRNGVLPTAVYGSPFDVAGTRDMLDRVELPAGQPPARLAMTPAAQQGELTRLVLVFDPAPAANDGAKACQLTGNASPPRRVTAERTRVLLAFCVDRALASESVVSVPNTSPPSIPAVADGISLALTRLLLPTPPNEREASCEGKLC
jgi:hypothetical protein